ncbi:DUF1836 domain-containing protein [Paenibacillus radicis (ex Gao et al. 2016)]|uniref:DUF1836 domain-containing protein n=1 Tax=Paenibacillus radicis (ex Gao et al. 2016) TaxID=1737354 RepID=A0A917H919_9BACL|nr:DUF1836 domain-containing protein [Paenibacillus radicis (ex Gao et al. 2016)]GGG71511.1 hypothetical protein GCM10010918_28820 [Paenibacillus radicis (ex Gao et al. 2016)]
METFTLTRKEMAGLLLALQGSSQDNPLQVLQQAWKKAHCEAYAAGSPLPAFLSTALPPVLDKLIKGNKVRGFSLQEISALGQLIEYSQISMTSMQNWVKRDFKAYFECPQVGKKYSLNQAALLYIIDDLKANLDFDSIRKLFDLLFCKPQGEGAQGDLINPLSLYAAYSTLFAELERTKHPMLEQAIRTAADKFAGSFTHLTDEQSEALRNILFIAALSIQTAYFHSLAKRYCNATLFLKG